MNNEPISILEQRSSSGCTIAVVTGSRLKQATLKQTLPVTADQHDITPRQVVVVAKDSESLCMSNLEMRDGLICYVDS